MCNFYSDFGEQKPTADFYSPVVRYWGPLLALDLRRSPTVLVFDDLGMRLSPVMNWQPVQSPWISCIPPPRFPAKYRWYQMMDGWMDGQIDDATWMEWDRTLNLSFSIKVSDQKDVDQIEETLSAYLQPLIKHCPVKLRRLLVCLQWKNFKTSVFALSVFASPLSCSPTHALRAEDWQGDSYNSVTRYKTSNFKSELWNYWKILPPNAPERGFWCLKEKKNKV